MKLYNTLTGWVQPFNPDDPVQMYVCGITPYDTTHIGHAFTYASMDILLRYLEMRGLEVHYVQNVTDIDDDILRKAKEVGEDWKELGNRWTRHYIQDMKDLNVCPPNNYPRATEVIPQIVDHVESLLDEGVAYEANGNVYYSVDSWPRFGRMCKLPPEEMLPIANERGNNPDDPHKRNPLDFVLWQAQAEGEPAWESPWGMGRPGWHIECSTMATEYLENPIDIHGGGDDLRFPHHECEIAQVEPVTDEKPFVRFWMHTAMVRFQGEKMSKSLGNLVMIRDLLEDYSADAIRLYLGSHHYRNPWEYEEKDLRQYEKLASKISKALATSSGDGVPLESEPYWASFVRDMDNDLHTPGALEVVRNLVEAIEDAALAGRDVGEAQMALRKMVSIFGVRVNGGEPDSRVVSGWNEHFAKFAEVRAG